MPHMAKIIEYLEKQGLRNGTLKIMVGGAPVTEKFASEIGADLYADNAIEAADIVKSLVKGE